MPDLKLVDRVDLHVNQTFLWIARVMRVYDWFLYFFYYYFQAVDLLKRFLVYHSKERISAAEVSTSEKK